MVEPVDVTIERSEPGEIDVEERVLVKYLISDVRAARIERGYSIAVGISVVARFARPPHGVRGICGPNTPYRPARFNVRRIASATVRTDSGETIEIFVEPVAVGIADDFITAVGEPCVVLQTVTAWRMAGG